MRGLVRLLFVGVVGVGAMASANTIIVNPGDSIQAAVDFASSGDLIQIMPGVYEEPGTPCPDDPKQICAVSITKDNIRLEAPHCFGATDPCDPAILHNPGGQNRGIVVAKPFATGANCLNADSQRIHKFGITGVYLQNFQNDGLHMLCVDNFRVNRVAAYSNGEYGIFVSHSSRGRIASSYAFGSNDVGIYVSESGSVRVRYCVAQDNVTGFEIENSSRVRIQYSSATGNTTGMLSATIPNLDVKDNRRNRIRNCRFEENNRPNTCLDPDDQFCKLPSGSGILMFGAHDNQVSKNIVHNNNSVGIGVAKVCFLLGLGDQECDQLDVDPTPDGLLLLNNEVTGNGNDPDSAFGAFAADLMWDSSGTGNCWRRNTNATQYPPLPFRLPDCQGRSAN
jgi:parallel beta-helix repeat protein